jgi:hypothetical protein
MAHLGDDIADQHVALSRWRVRLVQHSILAAAVAGDPHDP